MSVPLAPVPRVVTRWTTPDLLAAYDEAARVALGERLPRAALAILWGQAAIETGREGRNCYCFNVGNVRAGEVEPHYLLSGAYEFAAADKVPKGAIIIAPPPGAAVPPDRPVCFLLPAKSQRFRAFDSLLEGCVGKIGKIRRQWPAAIEALRLATDEQAARGYVLGLLGSPSTTTDDYFSGDPKTYADSAVSLARECLSKHADAFPVEVDPDPTPVGPSWRDERPTEVPNATDVAAQIARELEGIT